MIKKFTVTDKVYIFPMDNPWFFINIPLDQIPDVARRGWGSIPIMATIGKTTWRTSIFPMKKDNYFIPLKKTVRQNENIFDGEEITISYRLATDEEV